MKFLLPCLQSLQKKVFIVFFVTILGIFSFSTAQAATTLTAPQTDNYGGLFIYSILADGVSADNGPTTIVYITDSDGNVVTTTVGVDVDVSQNTDPLYLTPGTYQISEHPSDGYIGSFFEDGQTEDIIQCDSTVDGNVGGRLVVPDKRGVVSLACNIRQKPYIESAFIATTSTLKINEVVVNDNGDTKTITDFPYDFFLNDATTTQSGIVTTSSVLSVGDSYNVGISVPDSYAATLSGDCSGKISQPDRIFVCTVTIDDQELFLTDVAAVALGTDSIKLTWNSSHHATTRAVYDTVSHDSTSTLPLFGYAFGTDENSSLTLSHEQIITGLQPGTTYFFRAVSHGSPTVVSGQVSATTDSSSTGGGLNFSTGAGGGSGGSAPTPPPAPTAPQAVLGEKIVAPEQIVSPQTVLGFKTLPATGGPAQKYWYVVAGMLVSLGVVLLHQGKGDEE
jgi:hypothetical protein